MDIFAHAFWTYALFHKKRYKWTAALFGILPDIISFGPFMIYYHLLLGNNFRSHLENDAVFLMYNLTHSLIIFLVTVLAVYLIIKEIPWPLFGWGIHILIDIPTHTREFYPTPFLWPLIDLRFNGINWGTTWFMITNYSALVIVYAWIFYKTYKKKTNGASPASS